MPSTAVPAYAYWAGHSYYPSLMDPLSTANLAFVVMLGLVVVTALVLFRFQVFRKRQAKLHREHGWMVRKLDEFKRARREGRQDELDDLTFSLNDIVQAEGDLKRGRRKGHVFVAGLSVLALLIALCFAVVAICWGHWWVEGGYACTTPGQAVYNQLDPEGVKGRVNLCAPGIFTHPWLFVSHPKEAILETLYS